MPTASASELTRLTALINRLLPLAEVQRGDLITADNWNQMVGTVIEIAQIVLAEGARETVLPHEHQDQVKLAWLEPQLRQLIQAGPLSDPASTSALTSLERAVERLRERIIKTDQDLGSLRKRLDEVRTQDLQRENDVIGIRRSIDGLADARKDVFDLRTSLDTIKGGVAIALEASDKLTVDNEIVDFTALLDRVNSVEELFNTLKLADGTLLDAKVFDNRLAEFANQFVDEDELREALEGRSIEVPESALDSLRDELQGNILSAAREEWTTDVNNVNDSLRQWASGQVNEEFAKLDKKIRNNQSVINESLSPTSGFNRQQLDYMVTFFKKEFGDEFRPPKNIFGVDRLLGSDGTPTSIENRGDAGDTGINSVDVEKAINDAARAQVEALLPSALNAAVNTAVSVSVNNAVKTSVATAVDAALEEKLQATVNAAVSSSVTSAVNAAVSNALNTSVNSAVNAAVDAAMGQAVDAAVDKAMRVQLKSLSGDLRELVQSEVKRQVAETRTDSRTDSRTDVPRRGDDLTRIDGLGDALVKRLQKEGIDSFEKLAETDPRSLAKILRRPVVDAQRIVRDAKRLI